MSELRVRMGFGEFIAEANRAGLPVRFLNEVGRSNYNYDYATDQNETSIWFNTLSLTRETLASVTSLSRFERGAAASGILAIYHEATHAWFDIMEQRPDVIALTTHGRHYYAGSKRISGALVDDAERAFQEAAAEYVAHRASNYWSTLFKLSSFERMVAADPPVAKLGVALANVKKVPSEYNQVMAERRMGYQMTGPFGIGVQDVLTKKISPVIKSFCDRVLLENLIPDYFSAALPLRHKYDAFARKYPQLH